MSTFYPMEIHPSFRVDSVCDDHEKFFFILHQGTLDGSFPWNDDKIIIKHYPAKRQFSIENDSRSLINHTKMFLFLYDGLNNVLSDSLDNKFFVSGDYQVIKTNGSVDFDLPPEEALIYLPQTNQIIKHDHNTLDRAIFLTHAYVVIIPIFRVC